MRGLVAASLTTAGKEVTEREMHSDARGSGRSSGSYVALLRALLSTSLGGSAAVHTCSCRFQLFPTQTGIIFELSRAFIEAHPYRTAEGVGGYHN